MLAVINVAIDALAGVIVDALNLTAFGAVAALPYLILVAMVTATLLTSAAVLQIILLLTGHDSDASYMPLNSCFATLPRPLLVAALVTTLYNKEQLLELARSLNNIAMGV